MADVEMELVPERLKLELKYWRFAVTLVRGDIWCDETLLNL